MRATHRGLGAVLALALLGPACASSGARVAAPEVQEYVFPGWSPTDASPDEGRELEKAWKDVQAGHASGAEKRYRKLLLRHPGLAPAETGLGYALLRAGRTAEAGRTFQQVLARRADDVPALAGAALAAAREGRAEDALAHLRRAAAADARNEIVSRRLADVRLQVTERRVAAAREALAAGQVERAVEEYAAALQAAPEASEVRLALADLLVQRNDAARAISVLEAAPDPDRDVLLRLGALLRGAGEPGRALEAYRRVLTREPADEEGLRGARESREALELLQMPEEYRRIPEAQTVSRADLAALLMTKVGPLARHPPGAAKVAVDISGSWARDNIIRALSLDILDVYPNHTFQPAAVVRRGDLAMAVQRVLDLLKLPPAALAQPTDMSPNNLLRYPAGRVVSAGLMDLTEAGAFEAWRPVSGREAVDVVEGLVRLVGP